MLVVDGREWLAWAVLGPFALLLNDCGRYSHVSSVANRVTCVPHLPHLMHEVILSGAWDCHEAHSTRATQRPLRGSLMSHERD